MAAVKSFRFDGAIPASKSILNRLLVIQSFAPTLTVRGDSRCDDVLKMRSALAQLSRGVPADCGAAGTTFRFLALKASRMPGRHLLTGSTKLLERPQGPLLEIVQALGAKASLTSEGLEIDSSGWEKPLRALKVDRSRSSQFASAVLLSAWDLDFDLDLELSDEGVSEGYFEMTETICERAGLALSREGSRLRILRGSRPSVSELVAEPDYSSAFAVAALACASKGEARIEGDSRKSLQPDAVFPRLLEQMGAEVNFEANAVRIKGPSSLRSLRYDLCDSPDLFPVLSVLCALAEGRSVLHGAPHLAHKESSRIESTAALLKGLGVKFETRPDGIEIEGGSLSTEAFDFDPRDDHRLAMAAAVAQVAGSQVRVTKPEVVDKSFPEFWSVLEKGLA